MLLFHQKELPWVSNPVRDFVINVWAFPKNLLNNTNLYKSGKPRCDANAARRPDFQGFKAHLP